MKVRDVMSRDVHLAHPEQSIQQVACEMAEIDAGALPVADDDRLVGMITDRDIAIRAVAKGLGPATMVHQIMTEDVKYCFEDDELNDVVANMGENQIRRLPVLSAKKRLVGIISLGDIAQQHELELAGEAICDISQPGGLHDQVLEGRA